MWSLRLFLFLFLLIFIVESQKPKPSAPAKKSKLCGDAACNEVLFKSKIIRLIPSNHPHFLNFAPESMGKQIEVLGIKFSDRPDIADGRMEDGTRGEFYINALEKGPYVEFLRHAIDTKKEIFQISRDPADVTPEKKLIGVLHAELDLVRDYNVNAKNYAAEQGLPEPEQLPLPQPPAKGHGHSHDHHGHSHDHHGHSHEGGGHAHSHEPPPTTTPLPVVNEKPADLPKPTLLHPSMATPIVGTQPPVKDVPPVEEKKSEVIAENNKLETPENALPLANDQLDKVEIADMEAEIERMMREDEENLRKLQEEATKANQIQEEPPVEASPQEVLELPPKETPIVQEPLDLPPVTYPPPVATTQPPPVVEEQSPTTTAAPEVEVTSATPEIIVTQPPPPPATFDSPYKMDLPKVDVQPPQDSHGHSHSHDDHGHGHSHEHNDDHHGHSHSHSPPPPSSVGSEPIPEDPKPLLEEDKGYCYKNNDPECEKFKRDEREAPSEAPKAEAINSHEKRKYLEEEQFKDHLPSSSSGAVGSMISSITGVLRSILPVGDMSDSGVGLLLNLIFLVIALLFHFINKLLSDGGDQIGVSQRNFHDLITKNKELQAAVQSARTHAGQVNTEELHALQASNGILNLEKSQLKEQLRRAEEESEKYRNSLETLEREYNNSKSQAQSVGSHVANLERNLKTIEAEREDLQIKVKETKSALERLAIELKEEKSSKEDLLTERDRVNFSLQKTQDDLETAKLQIKDLEEEKNKLDTELNAMAALIEEIKNNKGSDAGEVAAKKPLDDSESGGSGGWSDFGDEPEEQERDKTPPTTTVDIREMAKLRGQIKKLEQDYEQAKSNLEREVQEKKRLEDDLIALKLVVEQKTREAEEKDKEKKSADERSTQMIELFKEEKEKIKQKENECRQLNDEVKQLNQDMKLISEEKANKEAKIKDLDNELKNLKTEFIKLETRSFAKEKEHLKTIHSLQSIQSLAPSSFEMSHAFSDRDNAPSRTEQHPTGGSIWDDPDISLPRSRTFSPDDDYMGPIIKKSSRSRRSDRIQREPSPSDGEKKRGNKEAGSSRRRSRSHGRMMGPYTGPMGPMPPYIPGGPGYPPSYPPMDPMYFGGELNKRNSRSGHVYYSSGGSNGGRSPPPEMPLVSAQPPPEAKRLRSRRAGDL